MAAGSGRAWLRAPMAWGPWVLLAIGLAYAVHIFVTFETAPDGEFPAVERPTFSPHPPASYRLAEPGDTLDRVALYASSVSTVLAALGWVASRKSGRGNALWPVALGLAVAAGYDASTPWPTFDGWHGLNWRAIGDSATPLTVKLGLGVGALGLLAWTVGWGLAGWKDAVSLLRSEGRRGTLGLLAVALAAAAYRVVGWPDAEPLGYWPRWAFALGTIAFGFAPLKAFPTRALVKDDAPELKSGTSKPRSRFPYSAPFAARWAILGGLTTAVLIAGGLALIHHHRPIIRLKAVVPGRIYLSGMPTRRGLEIAQARHGFKTIINVFNEDSPQRSPLLPDELAFAREHGIRYVGNPSDPLQADAFLDETLRIAQDPDAWPILVHCHGSMDRSPAWVGIYRFVVQGWPLAEVFREIEAHRGSRPKASVTLLYNRVLEPRAPARYQADPTARLLNQAAAGTVDPFDDQVREARRSSRTTPNPGRLR